jgi:uncharacterized protein (DUF1697 family)
MKTWVALFRGLNVGGSHILPMKDLIALLERAGCTDVKVYIQSGNVIFRHSITEASGWRAASGTPWQSTMAFNRTSWS